MAKEKKQFRELSEEDLKQVAGGGYIQLIEFDDMLGNSLPCQPGYVQTTDANGHNICVPIGA